MSIENAGGVGANPAELLAQRSGIIETVPSMEADELRASLLALASRAPKSLRRQAPCRWKFGSGWLGGREIQLYWAGECARGVHESNYERYHRVQPLCWTVRTVLQRYKVAGSV